MQEACSATTSSNRTIKCPSDMLFLYRHVIGREVGDLGKVIRARKPTRLPVVMTRDEVKAVLVEPFGRQVADGLAYVRRGAAPDGMPAA